MKIAPNQEYKRQNAEYQDMVKQMEQMQAMCAKMEQERQLIIKLNEQRVGLLEEKLDQVQKQRQADNDARDQDAQNQRNELLSKQQELRDEIKTIVNCNTISNQQEQILQNQKEIEIQGLKRELSNLHNFYQDKISHIEQNLASASFNQQCQTENYRNQIPDLTQFSQPDKRRGAMQNNQMQLMDDQTILQSIQEAQDPRYMYAGPNENNNNEQQTQSQESHQKITDRQSNSHNEFRKGQQEMVTRTSAFSLSPTQQSYSQMDPQLLIHITNNSINDNIVDSRFQLIDNNGSQDTQTFGGFNDSADAGYQRDTVNQHVYGSNLNGSMVDKIQQLDPSVRNLISSLQQHNLALTQMVASHQQQVSSVQNVSMSYGEKHRLIEQIHQLENVHKDVAISLQRVTVENQILKRLRYAHLQDPVGSDHLSSLLPICMEDEVFSGWCKFMQIINRCVQKCFTRYQDQHQQPSNSFVRSSAQPICAIDQDLLIQYIQKLVKSMQNIEKLVKRAPQSAILGHVQMGEINKQHLKVIDIITESSLKLSQMPALQHQYVQPDDFELESKVQKGIQDVVNTIYFWKKTVQLHLEFFIQEYRNYYQQKYNQQLSDFEKSFDKNDQQKQKQSQDEQDDFWSDFSDGDYRVDIQIKTNENDILYNLQIWLNSNSDEIDFITFFGQMAQKQVDHGDNIAGQNTYMIGCTQFMTVLLSSGYEYCQNSLKQRTDFMSLVRAISCSQKQSIVSMKSAQFQHTQAAQPMSMRFYSKNEPGYINYKQFLADIKEKPYKWWQTQLNGFLLDIQNEATEFADNVAQDATPIKKMTQHRDVKHDSFFQADFDSVQAYLPKPETQYEQFCQKIVMNRLVLSKQALQPLFESDKTHLTKSSLRKFILQSQQLKHEESDKLQLSRLDCHVLVKMLYKMNKEQLVREKDTQRRMILKNQTERIEIVKLQRLVEDSVQQEREERYRMRCQQLELGQPASSPDTASTLNDLSLPAAIECLFYNNQMS